MLAAAGAGHLVLTSRRGTAADGAAELAAELTELGALVTVAACDVADRDALAALLDSIPAEWPLAAVIHAAGVPQRIAPLGDLTLPEFAEVAHAKVAGALHLDELLGDRPLSAFVLFSSGSAVWGSSGQAAYAGANAVLDGIAQARRARGLTATSVAWGSWDGGMVGTELAAVLRRLGVPPMPPRLALTALRQVLEQDESQLVVADLDWPRFAPTYTLARPRPLLDALPEIREILAGGPAADASADPLFVSRLAGMSAVQQEHELLDLVRAQVAALLDYEEPGAVPVTRSFNDLGFDSVSAVDLRNRLSAVTGLKLAASIVFDYATPAALADHLRAGLCPATAGGEPVAALVDQLDHAMAELSVTEAERARLAVQLQGVLTKLDRPTEDVVVHGRLEAASAEDMFDFIDQEFGASTQP
jgi:NAD(P)-dependent dehydrogenase (short-subunit alcohol dehydrogenase family)/acyl carrier protein